MSVYTEDVPLPPSLREAIEQELAGSERSRIARAAQQITSHYNTGNFGGSLASAETRAAYLVTRLPATYAAGYSVFREIARLWPDFAPASTLDLGSGPGTASWAAAEIWPTLRKFTMVESNREFALLGRRLAQSSETLRAATWEVGDLRSTRELPSADLVVLSYAIGELPDPALIAKMASAAAKQLLVIIEPGTPRNFQQVARVRRELIADGRHVVAPCPHGLECPMSAANDWCHFSVRLERTAEHRRMKGGALGYEDEKFSYVGFAREPLQQVKARIVRHPGIHSGFIRLSLCTPDGLQDKTITRSQKDAFRAARRAKWGEEWPQFE